MKFVRLRFVALLPLLAALFSYAYSQTQPAPHNVPETLYKALKWRMIGPHRGGRVLAVSGVPGQPGLFYFGAVCGGVWKTTNAGEVWTPIFDDQPIASIGALAVAPSNPNVIYVGSGEADMRSDISFGNGMYKSTDAGKNWTHIGLDDTQQIGRVIVDPRDPNAVLVAALGHGFGPNTERGVFRTTDGGRTWKKTLYKDENTGAIDFGFDPANPQTVYVAMWNARRPTWNTYAPINGPGSGIYKSTDGGQTWSELKGNGLPTEKVGRIGLAVSGRRVYAIIEAEKRGLYRSDDAGATWQLVGTDQRIDSRAWYFSGVTVDPHNADVVYVSNVSLYRSKDGGHTFTAIKGAPGGDDYHTLWIDPSDSNRMILGSDQGTVISVDGAKSWTSWYNQPTAQFYHVAVDNQFPYWVYGAQQDSGTAAVVSRSDYGQITFRDWHPIGAGESGYILPDPEDPDVTVGGSTDGDLYRFTKKTGQVQEITPTPASGASEITYRYPWTTAIAYSSTHALYQGSQFLFRSTNNGKSWERISPDLTSHPGKAGVESEGKGVIYSVAPSPHDPGQLWIGTDNGLIQLTRDDGKTWTAVTPAGLPEWSIVSIIEASPFDAGTAYAAIDRHQADDLKPYIYRTKDFGKTWTQITNGIAAPAYVHAVREDPARKGLLYAGTELGAYVSFDDGEHWQPLQLNLPVTSIRDLVVKDNDLVVATHGRSFWILDNLTPLRQIDSNMMADKAYLFKPADAYRLRKNENRDTPLPPETPSGTNPPTGAIIDYHLKSVPSGDVVIEISDEKGTVIRRFSSSDKVERIEDKQSFPTYWLRPEMAPTKSTGLNRFVWDLRYPRPMTMRYEYGISAAYGADTPRLPEGPLVLPGKYQIRLTVDGRSYVTPLIVKMDPRVSVSRADLEKQFSIEMSIDRALSESFTAISEISRVREQLKAVNSSTTSRDSGRAINTSTEALGRKVTEVLGDPSIESSGPTFRGVNSALAQLMVTVSAADSAPTIQAIAAFETSRKALDTLTESWRQLKEKDLAELNDQLRKQNERVIELGAGN